MKISEYKNLNLFLMTLFKFFKENRIQSSLEPVENYDELLKRILDSDFINLNFNPGIEDYGIDFRLDYKIEDAEVYMLIFGNKESNKNGSLLIDLGERDLTSFLSFSWYEEKLPPFISDFLNKQGKLIIPDDEGNQEEKDLLWTEFMTLDEFTGYLNNNREQKFLNIIKVD